MSSFPEIPERSSPLRLWYMYRETVCTVIDVDDGSRKVRVTNLQEHPLYRAFGVNECPSYEDYLEFLESRCFPRTRDKMELELQYLGLSAYDPIEIIGKTEGRMAGDEFWIRMETDT
ncbi:MAG: hypothetical protein IJ083_03225 [Clostridia bacterium]|nr:hypothetical protein [Clostridia bacterium]